jgi:hypothetical protein
LTTAFIRALGAGRIAFGAAMLLRPEQAVRGWVGPRAAAYGGTQVVTQAFGARDLVLGAGAIAALAQGRDARDWVAAGALCDLVDLVATVRGDDLPLAGRAVVVALASAAIAVSASYLTSDDPVVSGTVSSAAL